VTIPERELRVLDLLRSLDEHKVEHVVFGAVALGFYGIVRATADLDVIVRPSHENVHRVHDWLVDIDTRLRLNPARTFGPRERWGMLEGKNATVTTKLGQVDVVQQIPGLPDWDTLVAEAELYELKGGLTVSVIARRTLVELKRGRSSKQDLADIEAIELLEE
jgi:hypothetical protein